jgi:transposase
MALDLPADERTALERRIRSPRGRAEDARRARVILMLADGASYAAITAAVDCYPAYVVRWKQHFEAPRLAGLEARYRGQSARLRTPAMEGPILAKTQQAPPDGSTR